MAIGLVLAGGGGKGSYQIGVLKALREYGWDKRITAISGTSVGALNAALFVQGDLGLAEEVWLGISPQRILSLEAEGFLKHLMALGVATMVPPLALLWAKRLAQHGIFSHEGLLDILQNQICLSSIKDSPIKAYATCFNLFTFQVEYFNLNGKGREDLISILLASSAIPFLFPSIQIGGNEYMDGGIGDNVPISPLYGLGCQVILVIYLDQAPIIHRDLYPNCTLLPIVPQSDQGGLFTGTLDFNPQTVKGRIQQGFEDAIKLLSPYQDLLTVEKVGRNLLKEALRNEEQLKRDKKEYLQEGDRLREKINSLKLHHNGHLLPREGDMGEELSLLPEGERESLVLGIEDFLQKKVENSHLLLKAALESVSYLGPLPGRTHILQRQGPFQQLLSTITGRNMQIPLENQHDLILAQYASLSLMKEIHQRGLMNLEFVIALNEKVNHLFKEFVKTKGELTNLSMEIYRYLSQLIFLVKGEILGNRVQIDTISSQVKLLEWLAKVKTKTYQGIPYNKLGDKGLFVCLLNDFFRLTYGRLSVKELLPLKEVFLDLDLEGKVNPHSFLTDIFLENSLTHRLFHNLSITPLALDLFMKELVGDPLTGDLQIEVPYYDLALELLYTMNHRGFKLKEKETNRVKEGYLLLLKRLEGLMDPYEFLRDDRGKIHELMISLKNYQLLVPILGVDNTVAIMLKGYLQDFKVDLTPFTLVATEIHLANSLERLLVSLQDGTVREYPLSSLEHILLPVHLIHHQKLFLKTQNLTADITLVALQSLDTILESQQGPLHYYLEEGSFFILPLKGVPSLKGIFELLGESFFAHQTYGLLVEEKEELLEEGLYQSFMEGALFVENLSPLGLKEGLSFIIGYLEESIIKEFKPPIKGLISHFQQSLKVLANHGGITLESLKEKREKLKGKKGEIMELLQKEEEKIIRELPSLKGKVMETIREVLVENKDLLGERPKARSPKASQIHLLIDRTFHKTMKDYSLPFFQASMERVLGQLSNEIQDIFTGERISFKEDFFQIQREISNINAIKLGLILFGPVFALLGGVIHVFQRSKRGREEVNSLIEEIMDIIEEEGENHLFSLGQDFIMLLKQRVQQDIKGIDRLMHKLQEELNLKTGETFKRRSEIEGDLLQLEGLFQSLTGTDYDPFSHIYS